MAERNASDSAASSFAVTAARPSRVPAEPVRKEPVAAALRTAPAARLRPFDPQLADLVAGWMTDARDLFWIAPKTPPPITGEKVAAWSRERGGARLLFLEGEPTPTGYGELHFMPDSTTHMWLGHVVLSRAWRGHGLGRCLTRLLLAEAFDHRRATRVSLIVFPDNRAAIRCYRRAGFVHLGEQRKFFETTRRDHRMLAMSIDRARYQSTRRRSA